MKVKHVTAFGGSLLIVQHVVGVFNVLKDHLLHILIHALALSSNLPISAYFEA